jgi:hypothetical protein
MIHMLEKRQKPYKKYAYALEEERGHDPHELEVSHVRSTGLTHSNIHVVDYAKRYSKESCSLKRYYKYYLMT